MHYLVFHLTIADTITCFITLPMETAWRATIEVSCKNKLMPYSGLLKWYAGNLLCKVLMMVRTGGFILSSNLLVVLSIDRLVVVVTMW